MAVKGGIKGSVDSFRVVNSNDVLVKADYKQKFQTESGIIFSIAPSVVEDRPTCGVIIGIGPEVEEPLKKGLKVHFPKTSGYDLFFDDNPDEWFILLKDESLLGYE